MFVENTASFSKKSVWREIKFKHKFDVFQAGQASRCSADGQLFVTDTLEKYVQILLLPKKLWSQSKMGFMLLIPVHAYIRGYVTKA
jgi:hypothetical protein